MNILALNTAFSNSDVAVLYDNKKDYVSLDSNAKQSENILVCVDNLLKKQNADIQNIDVMSVVVGPGSFTGIRIGVGLVKGMSVAKPSLKLVGICSLDLMAYSFENPKSDFWCVLNALSGNLFACKYSSQRKRLCEPKMLDSKEIGELSGTVVGLKQENLEVCTHFVEFNPQTLLEYTLSECLENNFVSENNLLPIYLRKSQAEVSLDNGNKKN